MLAKSSLTHYRKGKKEHYTLVGLLNTVKNIIKVPKTKKCSVARSVDWGEVSVGVEKVITTGETSGSRLWIWKQQLVTGLLLCPQLTSEDTL